MLATDDVRWKPRWLERALRTPNQGYIGLPDGEIPLENFCPHFLARREWLKEVNGGVLSIPNYKSWFTDVETARRAQRSGGYAFSDELLIEHLRKSLPNDKTYEIGRQYQARDAEIFIIREKAGFPDDFHAEII